MTRGGKQPRRCDIPFKKQEVTHIKLCVVFFLSLFNISVFANFDLLGTPLLVGNNFPFLFTYFNNDYQLTRDEHYLDEFNHGKSIWDESLIRVFEVFEFFMGMVTSRYVSAFIQMSDGQPIKLLVVTPSLYIIHLGHTDSVIFQHCRTSQSTTVSNIIPTIKIGAKYIVLVKEHKVDSQ